MLGIGLKRKVEALEENVSEYIYYNKKDIADLKDSLYKKENSIRQLVSSHNNLLKEFVQLRAEVQNPPKYKVGDQKGWYTVLKILPLEVASSNRRYYEVLNRKDNVVEGILESTLNICK